MKRDSQARKVLGFATNEESEERGYPSRLIQNYRSVTSFFLAGGPTRNPTRKNEHIRARHRPCYNPRIFQMDLSIASARGGFPLRTHCLENPVYVSIPLEDSDDR